MTNTELIEQAQQIVANAEESGTAILSPEDSDIIRRANMAQESRKSSGINPLIEGVLVGLFGEKRIAEQRLEELRQREIQVEKLVTEKSHAEKNLNRLDSELNTLRNQSANYQAAGQPHAIKKLFQNRIWAIGQLNFDGHLRQAATEALAAKVISENFGIFLESKSQEIDSTRARIKSIDGEIKKLTR